MKLGYLFVRGSGVYGCQDPHSNPNPNPDPDPDSLYVRYVRMVERVEVTLASISKNFFNFSLAALKLPAATHIPVTLPDMHMPELHYQTYTHAATPVSVTLPEAFFYSEWLRCV